MLDLIHEILNDYLVTLPKTDGTTIKIIPQRMLGHIAKKINQAIKKETHANKTLNSGKSAGVDR